jgi:glutamyl/glutaminyl-tRNA synthetase
MHIGTAFTALFNWMFARKHNGQFLFRIEDTDMNRSKPEFETDILNGMRWLGLRWDNADIIRQSERTQLYRARLEELLDSGKAFWRQYSAEEKAGMEQDGRTIRDEVIVLKDDGDPEREVAFDDIIRGRISVQAKNIGQLVIAKSLDEPLYHFAVVVDDIDMGITHVLRGEEHISNTPKQLLIYEALGVPVPQFAHLPLMLGADRSKLSKRNGDVSLDSYMADYLPEALLNFLGSLSFTFEPEMLTLDEMIAQFDLPKVHKSGAIFNIQKLNWFNTQYIRKLPPETFKAAVGHPELSDAAIPVMTERLERLSDAAQFSYLWEAVEYDGEILNWKDSTVEQTRRALALCRDIARTGSLTGEMLDALAVEKFDGKKGSVYWPLRVALSGHQNSAGPLDIARVIGLDAVVARIDAALAKLA